jgi:hypothetical protein
MATKKKTAPRKPKAVDLIVLVPSKWGLPDADIEKLQKALQHEANSTITRMSGTITVVTGVVNGLHPPKK